MNFSFKDSNKCNKDFFKDTIEGKKEIAYVLKSTEGVREKCPECNNTLFEFDYDKGLRCIKCSKLVMESYEFEERFKGWL